MENLSKSKFNKGYFFIVLSLMLVLPIISLVIELNFHLPVETFFANYHNRPSYAFVAMITKWFVFWAVGVRLLTAGLKQTIKPAFTLEQIFHIKNKESEVIVRELGFANICMGLIGVLSIFLPQWQAPAAFAGGLYMGIAGVNRIIKKPENINEVIAMVSDIFIFIVLFNYLISYLNVLN